MALHLLPNAEWTKVVDPDVRAEAILQAPNTSYGCEHDQRNLSKDLY